MSAHMTIPNDAQRIMRLRPKLRDGRICIKHFPATLTVELEDALLDVWDSHPSSSVRAKARAALLVMCLPVVFRLTERAQRRFTWLNREAIEDMLQEGACALSEAFIAYDRSRDAGEKERFVYFAQRRAWQALSEVARKQDIVRPPSNVQTSDGVCRTGLWLLSAIRKAKEALEGEGRPVSVENVAAMTGTSLDVTRSALDAWSLHFGYRTEPIELVDESLLSLTPPPSPSEWAERASTIQLAQVAAEAFRSQQKPRDQHLLGAMSAAGDDFRLCKYAAEVGRSRQAISSRYRNLLSSMRLFYADHYPELCPELSPVEVPSYV